MGLRPAQLAELCATFARAGLDLVKDDHGLADHPFCPFEARVEACLRAVDDAARDTGRRALYVPNLIGTPDRVRRQLEFAREAGVGAVMLSPMLSGLPSLAELAALADGLPIVAHPALRRRAARARAGALRQALSLVRRRRGHLPARRGPVQLQPRDLRRARGGAAPAASARAARLPRARRAASRSSGCPSCSTFYGPDCILLVGGSLYEAGDSLFERTRELVDRLARAASVESGAMSDTCGRPTRSAGRASRSSPYKADGSHFAGITRQTLFEGGDGLACQLRYFEVAPGGWSSLERHHHAHAVMIVRGAAACWSATG